MIYLELLLSFFQIGLLSFGGGMAALPLISQQVVDKHGWLTMGEFTDLITISEMTPGPIGINSSTFVGIRVAGIPGAVVAMIGYVAPACVLVSVLAKLYEKYRDMTYIQGTLRGLRPAIVALIAAAGVNILLLALTGEGEASFNFIGLGLFAAAFLVLRRWKPNPIYVMLGCAFGGGIFNPFTGGGCGKTLNLQGAGAYPPAPCGDPWKGAAIRNSP